MRSPTCAKQCPTAPPTTLATALTAFPTPENAAAVIEYFEVSWHVFPPVPPDTVIVFVIDAVAERMDPASNLMLGVTSAVPVAVAVTSRVKIGEWACTPFVIPVQLFNQLVTQKVQSTGNKADKVMLPVIVSVNFTKTSTYRAKAPLTTAGIENDLLYCHSPVCVNVTERLRVAVPVVSRVYLYPEKNDPLLLTLIRQSGQPAVTEAFIVEVPIAPVAFPPLPKNQSVDEFTSEPISDDELTSEPIDASAEDPHALKLKSLDTENFIEVHWLKE